MKSKNKEINGKYIWMVIRMNRKNRIICWNGRRIILDF